LTAINGEQSLIEARRLLPDLYLFAVLPHAELLAAGRRVAVIVAAITLMAILITGACLFLALHLLVIRPLQRLEILSKEIGRGQLDVKHHLRSGDEIGELARAFQDMAQNLRNSDEQIRFIAYHDSLTGLPNRAMFREYLNHVIADARRNGRQFALLFLDIDDFKRVNDTLGHQAGDRLLQDSTERLSQYLRRSDYVARSGSFGEPEDLLARLGGDEFVILLPNIKDPHAASSLASRLIAALAQPLNINEHEFYVSASIGITLYPSDGKDADELIKNADIAMYHAKKQGKNDYQFYLESMNVIAHERLNVESKLRKALENNELCLHYQPQVDAMSGAIVGLEALLRWQHPEDGFIPPGVFVPVAEETGLIVAMGEWVINEACRQGHAWCKAGLSTPPVSVNISAIQFGKQDVAQYGILSERGYDVIQGYLFSRPLPAEQIPQLLKKRAIKIPGPESDTAVAAAGGV